jgi:hypothetical protein
MVLAMVNLVSLILLQVMPAWFPLGWPRIYDLANPVVPLAATICLLMGAFKMRNLSSYNWSLAAALLALLPPPLTSLSWLWPVGLGLGIWALITIHQPEVKSAFGRELPGQAPHPTAGTGPVGRPVIPIISRKAIIGACLAAVLVGLGLLGSIPLFLWRMSPNNSFHMLNALRFGTVHGEFAWLHAYLPWWLLLGIPIATTILGLVAIKDIRYSNGRIIGLSLALADALFFPLLGLNGLVLLSLQAAVRGTGLHLDTVWMVPEVALPFFLSGLLLCAALNYIIVRACWRAARRPVA